MRGESECGDTWSVGLGHAPEERELRGQFLPRGFDRCSQAEATTTRRQGGLGIRLAIAKQLVELQGGSIEAFSKGENMGATFIVRLPVCRTGVGSTDSRRLRTLGLSGAGILLVEDDPDTREFIHRILADAWATVVEAAGAHTAE